LQHIILPTEETMPMEGPPGGSQEMVWGKCPQCGGTGTVKDPKGSTAKCSRCSGRGQIKTR
jgi:hypothetical protein